MGHTLTVNGDTYTLDVVDHNHDTVYPRELTTDTTWGGGLGEASGVARLNVGPVHSRSRPRRPIVCFTFDDTYAAQYTLAYPVFVAKNVVGTLAITNSYIGTTGCLTEAQIDTMVAAGWEISSHGATHTDVTRLKGAALTAEIVGSLTALQAYGWEVPTWSPPYGSYWNREIRDLAMTYYRGIRGAQATSIPNNMLYRPDAIAAYVIDTPASVATYQGYIDTAITNNDLLVFYMHDVDADDATVLDTLIDYAQAREVDILTLSQAMDEVEAALQIGDFHGGGVYAGEHGLRVSGKLRIQQGQSIRDPEFSGSGLDDMQTTVAGYTGGQLVYVVEIDAAAATDTFKWSDDGGSTWDATGVAITGAAQTLNNGFRIRFKATTGHTLADKWTIRCNNHGGGLEIGSPGTSVEHTNIASISSAGVVTGASFTAGTSAGATGTFTTVDGKTVTVTGGIITAIV